MIYYLLLALTDLWDSKFCHWDFVVDTLQQRNNTHNQYHIVSRSQPHILKGRHEDASTYAHEHAVRDRRRVDLEDDPVVVEQMVTLDFPTSNSHESSKHRDDLTRHRQPRQTWGAPAQCCPASHGDPSDLYSSISQQQYPSTTMQVPTWLFWRKTNSNYYVLEQIADRVKGRVQHRQEDKLVLYQPDRYPHPRIRSVSFQLFQLLSDASRFASLTSRADPTTCIVVSEPQRYTLTTFSIRVMSAMDHNNNNETDRKKTSSKATQRVSDQPRPSSIQRNAHTFKTRVHVLRLGVQLLLQRDLLLLRWVRLVVVLGTHAIAIAVQDEDRSHAGRQSLRSSHRVSTVCNLSWKKGRRLPRRVRRCTA